MRLHGYAVKRKKTGLNMSFAWKQFRLAVKVLAGTGPQRERLMHAYTNLIELREKDLPSEIRTTFIELTQDILCYPSENISKITKNKVDALNETEVDSAIHAIIDMYDTVTRYQPMQRLQELECTNAESAR